MTMGPNTFFDSDVSKVTLAFLLRKNKRLIFIDWSFIHETITPNLDVAIKEIEFLHTSNQSKKSERLHLTFYDIHVMTQKHDLLSTNKCTTYLFIYLFKNHNDSYRYQDKNICY